MTESYYATLNAVYGPRSRSYHPVISKDDELLTPTNKIKDTWVEYFNDLLNQPTDVSLTIADDIDQLPVIESMNHRFEEQELDQALNITRFGKKPGPDGILPEILVHRIHRLRAFLLVPLQICWTTQIIPSDYCSKKTTEINAAITDAYRYSVLLEKPSRMLSCRGFIC